MAGEAFELGVEDALIKVAQKLSVQEVARFGSGSSTAPKKPTQKKPSRKLGLGEETMDMGETKMNKAPLDQPAKPQRY